MIPATTLAQARETLDQFRAELLAARNPSDHWSGQLSSSALSTATAISALSAVATRSANGRASKHVGSSDRSAKDRDLVIRELVIGGVVHLAGSQNHDGGFGDTDRSRSNIATTYLVLAADSLARRLDRDATIGHDAIGRAERYVEQSGGIEGLKRRYGKDKTFVVPILTNLAIAGRVDWRSVPSLPFELAAVPRRFYAAVRMPVVSYAVPALVAIGQVKHHHCPSRILPLRWLRNGLIKTTLSVLGEMQPESGGYLEATPLTSFVLMALADAGMGDTAVARRCEQFLLDSVRGDSSWPIDTNLATWVTSLAIEALASDPGDSGDWKTDSLWDWHGDCQYDVVHRFTDSPPGGWGWTDLSGAVPDGDDTPAAILATSSMAERGTAGGDVLDAEAALDRGDSDQGDSDRHLERDRRVEAGRVWLSKLQNRDGGLPTFCRGWGRLPFDRSSVDLTAHAIRSGGIDRRSALRFIGQKQNRDGSWSPLWFGNQDRDDEDNPVYGTSRVLMAAADLPLADVLRGIAFLIDSQNEDGGWGGGPSMAAIYGDSDVISSVEETSLAAEALAVAARLPAIKSHGAAEAMELAIIRGVGWLANAAERGWHKRANPIGFYFAKLWYYEDLYPLIFATRALGAILGSFQSAPSSHSGCSPGIGGGHDGREH